MFIFSLIIALFNMVPAEKKEPLTIPSIFSDNMVLQQNSNVPFWGTAGENETIIISGNWGSSAEARAGSDGEWKAELETPDAGGPFEVTLKTKDTTVIFRNVLIGEVWICSGQSNMEMPLLGWPPRDTIRNSASEIKNADYPQIRLFTVHRAFSNKKELDCNGTWDLCSPKSAANFSATAYFFGKNLYNELKVPIGLIHTSWGGTPVQSWMSKEYLTDFGNYGLVIDSMENASGDFEKYEAWLNSFPVINVRNKEENVKWKNLSFKDENCPDVNYSDGTWKEMILPTLWERTSIGDFDGVIWFRKKIEIPSSWSNTSLVLELGPIDDMDRTFVNGKLVGSYETQGYWNIDRLYNIPKEDVAGTEITIAVRIVDNQGGGGIYGSPEKMKIYPAGSAESLTLAGSWKYLPVAEYRDQRFFVFGPEENVYNTRPSVRFPVSDQTPTALYNAMIHPVVPFSVRGAIWYQGEANVGEPEVYSELFPLMIKNWRDVWGNNNFPFYYVQIAPFNYGEGSHSEKLREAQLKALRTPNTGMVVTLDIGNPENIHPSNKQDVGKRLAALALCQTYGKQVPCLGPVYKSAEIEENRMILTFDHADKLVLKELNGKNNFLIAGDDRVFKKASVKVDGNELVLFNPEITKPAAVRYAWDNTSQATLFNEEGLPSSSFRTDDWSE